MLGGFKIQGGGHNDGLKGVESEQFSEKLFQFKLKGILSFGVW